MRRGGSVIIRLNKAYIPSEVIIDPGAFMQVDPVYIADLNIEDLTSALAHVLTAEAPAIPMPTPEELKNRRDPLLAATGVRSWKALARDSLAYGISWSEIKILIHLPEIDKQGRFAAFTTTSPKLELPAESKISDIASAILGDAMRRLQEGGGANA